MQVKFGATCTQIIPCASGEGGSFMTFFLTPVFWQLCDPGWHYYKPFCDEGICWVMGNICCVLQWQ